MKNLIVLLLLAGLCWFIISFASFEKKVQEASPPTPRHATQTPQAKFLGGDGTITVMNQGNEDWKGVQIFINSAPPFGYSATISIKAGKEATFRLRDFTKDNGERFDPVNYKLMTVWIGGVGYDYEKYAF